MNDSMNYDAGLPSQPLPGRQRNTVGGAANPHFSHALANDDDLNR